jgi:O-acetyl-ADP-ribose deacetylase (regulator of RNase III)
MPLPRERQWVDVQTIKNRPPADYVGLSGFPSLQRYTNYSFLGAGAFGRVYAAVHAELGRIEAVKRIEIRDPRQRQMALAEAETLARFPPHPNLVSLYNAEADDRALYLLLQYIDGVPADALPLPLPIGQALSLVRDTAQALSLVHAHGIVHRDIKPANLFCTRTGTGVVGDFGVARAKDSTAGMAAVAGSPGYMAPEAFLGKAGPASDLWSLGVMLFELLTGHRPFENLESLPLSDMPMALSSARLQFPSALRPEVPRGVDDLVAMLLSIRPEDRPPSAMAVVDHLPRYNTIVSVVNGDLLSQQVDAIVYSANERLIMTKPNSLDKQVLQRAGQGIQIAAQKHAPARVGSVVVTDGGTLPARYVFHAVALHLDHQTGQEQPVQERDLRKSLWACFRRAHEMRLRTLALPAIGTSSGASAEDVARMLVDVTHTYLLEFRPPLEQVIIVLRDRALWVHFREAATERGMLLV